MPDLDALARELEHRARNVERLADELTHQAAVAVWTSVAADAFRSQVSRRHRDIDAAAGMLRSAATAVRHFAHDAELERERLRRLEHAAVNGLEHGVARLASLVGGL